MDVIVKSSPIHGKGIFANRVFKKGEIVLKWDTSHKLTKKQVDKLSDEEREYISCVDGEYVVMQEPEKYINHSCSPNTTAINFCDVAIKNIKKGEEITADYSEELVPGEKMKCNCRNKNCRKIIRPK